MITVYTIRGDVSVSHCSHGNDGPPNSDRDIGEILLINEVHYASKYEYTQQKEYDHQHQFSSAYLDNE